MNKKIKNLSQILTITFIVMITIIGGIMASLSVLEEETTHSKIKVAQLQADTFAQSITQTMNNAELLFDNLHALIELKPTNLNKRFKELLENNPQIRSISYLDNNNIITHSSNIQNIGHTFTVDNFYPKPFFDQSILRVGNVFIGRDIYKSVLSTQSNTINKLSSTFIPIAQNKGEYTLILAVNPDYFINKFTSKLEQFAHVDILRLDDTLLASSDKHIKLGSTINENPILVKTKESSKDAGVTMIDNQNYIVSYHLTPQYPFNISVRIEYEKSLEGWEAKRYTFFAITTTIVAICVVLVLLLIFLYNQKHQQEIKRHKLQIKNQKKFKVLFENTHFLSSIVSEKGIIEDINQCALDFLKKDFQDIIHTTFWEMDCFNEEDQKWLKQTIKEYKSSDNIYREFHVYNGNQEKRILDFVIFSIDIDKKRELVLIFSDITERKQYEYKLKEALTVFENTHDGIIITDDTGKILNVNSSFEAVSGYTKEEVLYKNPNILKSDVHDEDFYKSFWKDLKQTGAWEGEFINKKKNGELWSEWLVVNEVRNKEGTLTNYIGIFHDTTKLKNQEKELKKKEEILYHQSKMAAMGEMIENIAHQWRQPLSVISSISTGILVLNEIGNFNKEDALKDLKTINKTAQFLSKTIDDFRNFLRNDKNKQPFIVRDALQRTLDIVKSKLRNRNIEVITNMPDLKINGYENELIQVFMNIINNARDILETKEEQEKYIFIDGYEKNGEIIITIKDNAGGVPETIIEKIFEPYFTTKHKTQGTGIGLYMSEKIIHAHMGGQLSVSNETFTYKDHSYTGACFKIVLSQ